MLLPVMIACRRFVDGFEDLFPLGTRHPSRPRHAENTRFQAVFSLFLAQQRSRHQSTAWIRRQNLCFSTVFSTVVENFGGRPYGACRTATMARRTGDCNTPIERRQTP